MCESPTFRRADHPCRAIDETYIYTAFDHESTSRKGVGRAPNNCTMRALELALVVHCDKHQRSSKFNDGAEMDVYLWHRDGIHRVYLLVNRK